MSYWVYFSYVLVHLKETVKHHWGYQCEFTVCIPGLDCLSCGGCCFVGYLASVAAKDSF